MKLGRKKEVNRLLNHIFKLTFNCVIIILRQPKYVLYKWPELVILCKKSNYVMNICERISATTYFLTVRLHYHCNCKWLLPSESDHSISSLWISSYFLSSSSLSSFANPKFPLERSYCHTSRFQTCPIRYVSSHYFLGLADLGVLQTQVFIA